MKCIYVFRHGQTDWNKEGRIQGHLDVPLNETGRAQARALGPVLQRLGVQAFVTSDLSRAYDTAAIAAGTYLENATVIRDPRLREIHLGALQGKTREEIERDHGVEFSHRLRTKPLSDADVAAVGSERGRGVFERASEAILDFARTQPFDRIGVATHGGVVRRLIQYSREIEDFPAPIPNGIVYPFRIDPVAVRLVFPGFTPVNTIE